MKVAQKNGEQMSKLSQTLANKAQYIYKGLIKLGYPSVTVTVDKYEQTLSSFIKASDSRLELIEWLIAMIYPGYRLDSEYKNSYDDDAYLNKVKRLSLVLWQLGVMPVAKHTKNLDYHKYVEGLLGYQRALNLIYDLVELADAKFSPNISKIQQTASDFLKQLISHGEDLVNVNYDPYGVSFPPRYDQANLQSVNQLNQIYTAMLPTLNETNKDTKEKQHEIQSLLSEADSYKQLFKRKYQKLSEAIQRITNHYDRQLPVSNRKQISQLHNRRVLKINKDLCDSYRNYHKLISSIKQQQFNINSLKQLKKDVLTSISALNEVTHIYQ